MASDQAPGSGWLSKVGGSPSFGPTGLRCALLKPDWLRVKAPKRERIGAVADLLQDLQLNTVCQEASCPNIGECFAGGTATFLIWGPGCTRACPYCDIDFDKSVRALDPTEPARLGEAVARLGLSHVVITSVNRDDFGRWRRQPVCGLHRPGARPLTAHHDRTADPRFLRQLARPGRRDGRRARCAQPQHRDGAKALQEGAAPGGLRTFAGAAAAGARGLAAHLHQIRPDGGSG